MYKPSSKIISIYLAVGILWILISDRSFAYFGFTGDSILFQTLKGSAFIVISGFVFWIMLRRYENKNQKYLNKLKSTAEELMLSNKRYTVVTKATNNIIWDWDFKKDKVIWGESLKRILGYPDLENHSSWWTDKIHPEDKARVAQKFDKFLETANKEKWSDEYRIITETGTIKHVYDRGYLLFNKKRKAIRMIGSLEDITERKVNEQRLKELNIQINKRVEELALSNAELEQFAYIASHDLQEPLRMITRFLSEIQRKYDDKLDDKGKEYIHYAVDGAHRMRNLILDLLEYSKVGKFDQEIEEIDLNTLIEEVTTYNEAFIKESKAVIKWDNLPIINNRKTPLQLVFQNLIGNALKYHKTAIAPEIMITHEDMGNQWLFSVSDNGIGIDPMFNEKIFVIFQRLHAKNEYSGTGIGLAMCKKIIEGQGGRIWLKSEEGQGSTFYFTVSK
ncbi:two-component system CheB/CheR fusion protein [Flavobacterium gossypii]|uniref:histidine kinase n=2 Tax=Flavobacterium TaxID=237 RepID=A0A495MHF7_9FLAO|nr:MULTISPECIES: PAS domain-containing sensor histidine kinase [Flavobacterium]MBA9072375.1 two-component system CheB/CheR fusion protein [Flavobacterium gossypii]RKS25421.1 PAS domain S-box-containing protein [Flavobacterium endophyticum]